MISSGARCSDQMASRSQPHGTSYILVRHVLDVELFGSLVGGGPSILRHIKTSITLVDHILFESYIVISPSPFSRPGPFVKFDFLVLKVKPLVTKPACSEVSHHLNVSNFDPVSFRSKSTLYLEDDVVVLDVTHNDVIPVSIFVCFSIDFPLVASRFRD